MTQKVLLVIVLTVLLINSVISEEPSYEEKQAYLKKLLHLQEKMHGKVQQLSSLNQQAIKNAEGLHGQTSLQKTTLEQASSLERSAIEEIFQQTAIPFEENYWTCKDLTPDEQQLIEQKISDLQKKTQNIEDQVEEEGDCTRNDELKHHVRFLKLHIDSLESELGNPCSESTRKDKRLTDNLDTDAPWVYGGDLTPKQHNDELQKIAADFDLVNCPEEKPFLVEDQCTKPCPDEEIFSLSEQKCVQCQQDEIFLKENHECRDKDSKEYIPNLEATPFIWGPTTEEDFKARVSELEENGLAEPCPESSPASTGTQCINCDDLFNVANKQCTSCPTGEQYVEEDHSCKPLILVPNFNSGTNWIASPQDKQQFDDKIEEYRQNNYPIEQCPDDKPFPSEDSTTCIACDKYYDIVSKQCRDCEKYFYVKENSNECVYYDGDCGDGKFWNGQTCLHCNQPGQIDLNLKECRCPEGTQFHPESGNCYPVGQNLKNPNPQSAINFIGTVPEVNELIGNCPEDRPFYSSSREQCIKCELPYSYFDYDDDRCRSCEEGNSFDPESKECTFVAEVKNSNVDEGVDNYCCGEPDFDDSLETCSKQTPYFDGRHCIACSEPNYFDFSTKSCKECRNGDVFSSMLKKCVEPSFVLPKFKSNNPQDRGNYYGPIPTVIPSFEGQNINQCPDDKPYYDGSNCLKCQLPHYFNFEDKSCETCPQGNSFDLQNRKCSPNSGVGDYLNSNLVGAENFIGTVPPYKRDYPQCSQDQRYFDGSECIECDLPRFFNFDTKQCQDCDQYRYFDLEARKCFYENQQYTTNMEADNIFYNGDFEQLKREVEAKEKKACGLEHPFFDREQNKCIACEGDDYIWNFRKNHCMHCPGDTHFNSEHRICFQNAVSPTVERMAMNSIGWI